jgi:hypothetical protein
MKRKGRTHTRVTRETVAHLADPTKKRSQYVRFLERLLPSETVDIFPGKLLFPALHGRTLYDKSGTPLSEEAHAKTLNDALENRAYYWSVETSKKTGKTKRRKVAVSNPVQVLAVTVRPDFAIGFARIDARLQERDKASFARTIARLLQSVGQEFDRMSTYERLASEVHTEEGNLHFHLPYTVVSADGHLLHAKQEGRGRRGERHLGPSHVGTIRLADAGFLAENEASLARHDLADRMENSGNLPIDLHLSRFLDSTITAWLATMPQAIRDIFDGARRDYQQDLDERRADRPSALRSRVADLEAQLEAARVASGSKKCLYPLPSVSISF